MHWQQAHIFLRRRQNDYLGEAMTNFSSTVEPVWQLEVPHLGGLPFREVSCISRASPELVFLSEQNANTGQYSKAGLGDLSSKVAV